MSNKYSTKNASATALAKDEKPSITSRPPIVTVMGHVDHGKTSILDAVRKTSVQTSEYGGITQHIGAYQVIHNSKKITFIDTPGHEAFAQMRTRGGKVADIVVLVVSATESVKPQTIEAISIIKNLNLSAVVAINKIDAPEADVKKVKQELANNDILVEDWGGNVVCVEVSAKTGENIEKLLDSILAVAELLQLKYEPTSELEAIIIEARLDKQKGAVVSCVVKSGTLSIGDKIIASGIEAKVRMLTNDQKVSVSSAFPGDPVEIMGFKDVPNVGDLVLQEGSELAELSISDTKTEIIGRNAKKTVALVLKADTKGTLEAVKASLAALIGSSVGSSYALKFIHSATGPITDSDVMLIYGSGGGIVLGFNVQIFPGAADLAESLHVSVKSYKAIYELVDNAQEILEGSALSAEKKIKGRAKVLKLFPLPSGDVVLGSLIAAGVIREGQRVAIYDKDPGELTKDDTPLFRTEIINIKKGKESAESASKSEECGILLKPAYADIKPDMWIEAL